MAERVCMFGGAYHGFENVSTGRVYGNSLLEQHEANAHTFPEKKLSPIRRLVCMSQQSNNPKVCSVLKTLAA